MTIAAARTPDGRPRVVAPDPIESLLRELITEVQGLRADLVHERERHHKKSAADLVLTLAASVENKAFSTREVIAHATRVEGDLSAALEVAGLSNPRQLGKWLRTIEGRTIAGVRLERIGIDRDGIIWRVWRV